MTGFPALIAFVVVTVLNVGAFFGVMFLLARCLAAFLRCLHERRTVERIRDEIWERLDGESAPDS